VGLEKAPHRSQTADVCRGHGNQGPLPTTGRRRVRLQRSEKETRLEPTAQTRPREGHFVHFPGRHGAQRLAHAQLVGVVPIFASIFKDQQVFGVFSELEIFIFPESDKNIPAASSGLFLLSRINCSEIRKCRI
jgi:hypothetical protein